MHCLRSHVVIVLFLFIYPIISLANSDYIYSLEAEGDFFDPIPSVISATRINQPLTEAPSSVTIIDRNMIDASGFTEVADLLRLVPGMQVSYPQGNQMAVTYHGLSDAFPRKMQVLVNGRSVYQPSFADVDWLFLGVEVDDIDKIEVVRGANAPLYGANAIQGVINVITKKPYQSGYYIRYLNGYQDSNAALFSYTDNAESCDYRISASYKESAGLPGNVDSTNDDYMINGLSFHGIYQLSMVDELDMQLSHNVGDLGAGAVPSDNPEPHEKYVSSSYQYINWLHSFNSGSDSNLRIYHNTYKSDHHYKQLLSEAFGLTQGEVDYLLEGRPDQFVDFGIYDYEGEKSELEWQFTSAHNDNWKSMFGIGFVSNKVRSEVLLNVPHWISDNSQRIFTHMEYDFSGSWIASLGLMLEKHENDSTLPSSHIAINYLLGKNHSFRLSYAKSYRHPSLLEDNFKSMWNLEDGTQFFEVRRSLHPDAEITSLYEFGFIGYWMKRDLLLDLKIFNEKTDDVIYPLRDPTISQPFTTITTPVYVWVNNGSFQVVGSEVQLKYLAGKNGFVSIQYSNAKAESSMRRYTNLAEFWSNPAKTVPRHTYSMLMAYSFANDLDLGIGFYSVSDMTWLGDGDDISHYKRLDLRVAKKWKLAKKELKTEFIIQNLGDDYNTFRYENILETRAFIRLAVEL